MGRKAWTITADKFLSESQVRILLEHVHRERDLALARGNHPQAIRDYYMIHGLLGSGVRVTEFCKLLQSDLNGQKLVVREGKGKKSRTILLTKKTAITLKEWVTIKSKLGMPNDGSSPLFPSRYGRRYSARGVEKRIKLILEVAGLPDHFSVHSLRHTYCSMLLATGKVGLPTAKENMGHGSIAVTNLYAHAIGKIGDDVELISEGPGSDNCEKDEPRGHSNRKKPKNLVKGILRSTNFRRGDHGRGGSDA